MKNTQTNSTQFGCSPTALSKAASRLCSDCATCLEHHVESQVRGGRTLLSLIILLLTLIVPTWAQIQAPALDAGDAPVDTPRRQYLLGDLGGIRTRLAEKGIVFH